MKHIIFYFINIICILIYIIIFCYTTRQGREFTVNVARRQGGEKDFENYSLFKCSRVVLFIRKLLFYKIAKNYPENCKRIKICPCTFITQCYVYGITPA